MHLFVVIECEYCVMRGLTNARSGNLLPTNRIRFSDSTLGTYTLDTIAVSFRLDDDAAVIAVGYHRHRVVEMLPLHAESHRRSATGHRQKIHDLLPRESKSVMVSITESSENCGGAVVFSLHVGISRRSLDNKVYSRSVFDPLNSRQR